MQDKLSRDPEQLELLREFMNLQKEMMIMLLSMLEGREIAVHCNALLSVI